MPRNALPVSSTALQVVSARLQQFPVVTYDSYTTYVGGVS
jgi:hypothetical protein